MESASGCGAREDTAGTAAARTAVPAKEAARLPARAPERFSDRREVGCELLRKSHGRGTGGPPPRSAEILDKLLLRPAALAAAVALALAPLAAAQELQIPANDGWVTDLGELLTNEEEQALEGLMESYKAGSGHEVALLTLPDLGQQTIERLALEVARSWRIGGRDLNDGALLVVAKAERELRIEVGRGLEGTLTDSLSGRIIRDVIVPEFKAGRWYPGLRKGIEAIHAAAGGDYGPIERSPGGREGERGSAGWTVFLVLLVLFIVLRRGSGGRHVRRRGSSMLPWLIASQLGSLGRSSGRSISGGFGGFRGGGGGFGGFGGGGGFSGGGASGRW